MVHLHQEDGRGVSVRPKERGNALAQMREELQRSLTPAAPPTNRGYLFWLKDYGGYAWDAGDQQHAHGGSLRGPVLMLPMPEKPPQTAPTRSRERG